ncbi:MAG: exosortase-associated EpsI family protein [Pirellulaceae bacterium]|nr:exosortase-associated EpsI family protein [Planctomycetales bacterium]
MATKLGVPILAALVILAAGTYMQAQISERWVKQDSTLLQKFDENLDNVPTVIGDWVGEDEELPQDEFQASNCKDYISRNFTNQKTGEVISMFLVCGTARNVTIHTPDWCYVGAGFKMESKPAPVTVECEGISPSPVFSTTTFLKTDDAGDTTQHVRILWSYSDSGVWEGPSYQKFHFRGRPALYKVYIISPVVDSNTNVSDSSAVLFAQMIMPILNQSLFGDAPAADIGSSTTDSSGDDLTGADVETEEQ